MPIDRYGLEVTTASNDAFDLYTDAIDRMLAAEPQVEDRLLAAIEADPDFALAHAAMARQMYLYGQGKEAKSMLGTASELVQGATEREQHHVEILAKLTSGKVPEALTQTHKHIKDYPRDAFVLAPSSGVFGSIGFSGRLDREAEQLSLLEPLVGHYGDDWWFQTVYAFALLETGQWERGRDLARQALEKRPTNAHAAHTLAHALYEGGQDDEALAFMEDWLPTSDPASLMHCHNWWHYSILLMTAGRDAAAWEAFSQNCLPGRTTSPSINILTDSTSFLWRRELAGGARDTESWDSLRLYYGEQFGRPIVFVDAHIGLIFAALGQEDELRALVTQLREMGEDDKLPAGTTAMTITQAYEAFENDNWAQVIDLLEPMIDQVVRIGGSRAQRDLVTNTMLAAYVKDGRPEQARAFLEGVSDRRPTRPIAGLG